ncbi:hypothetical protein [Kibdelosporangium persicum]|uniref:hypothetical protein n=1 Tax=Kibdelosporangium persicum TaxID=2698649 RepID=UPI001563ACA2|nr:hypothetical protein [Kibdelosporangium persicum]
MKWYSCLHLCRISCFTVQLAHWSVMELEDPRKDSDPPERAASGDVIPLFGGGGVRGQRNDEARRFETSVHYVTGHEAEWLRRELTGVVRELLLWARDEPNRSDEQDKGWEAA